MTRRYFLPELPLAGGRVSLPENEAQHAIRVMRVQAGQAIELFDGKGHQSEARVLSFTRRECWCAAEPAVNVNRESSRNLQMAIALPKPDRAKELIERLTELGVRTVIPLIAQRTQRPPSQSLLEKLRRGIIEACKQCGRNHLMEIRSPQSSLDFFSSPRSDSNVSLWIAHPEGAPLREQVSAASSNVVVAIGPEGGWTDVEIESASNFGFGELGLGSRIYRIETAAIIIGAMLND
ncbi:MAG: 16S rRNA (uracil(1498)-N(3))-methyltransferase [Pirellulales bacterium]|nr:16S rRNA (uracil(1498)-N(3))-methyltransferase [Pirellulales bacterium]